MTEPVHASPPAAPSPLAGTGEALSSPSPPAGEGRGEGSRKPRAIPPSAALTASGRLIDLANPQPADIDFNEIADTLAVLPRFAGHCRRGFVAWTVAEHSLAGADLLAGAGKKRLALLFLLHDAHEAYIGDITSPTVAALVECSLQEMGPSHNEPDLVIRKAIRRLKSGLDAAIFAAAGVDPPSKDEIHTISHMDVKMTRAEMAQIMNAPWGLTPPGQRELRPLNTRGALRPAGKPAATAAAFIQRLDAWAPQARRRDAA